VDLSVPGLYWTENDVVRAMRLDGSNVATVAKGAFPTGVAVDMTGKKLYWADNGSDTISRSNLDGSKPEVVYTSPDRFGNPHGVAVDGVAGMLFWTESSAVKSASLDGTGMAVAYTRSYPTGVAVSGAGDLFFTDNTTDTVSRGSYDAQPAVTLFTAADSFDNPTSVAVDTTAGFVFWGQVGGVYRMAIQGSGAPIKVADAAYCDGVAVDPVGGRVYFTDNVTDTIASVLYDGSVRVELYRSSDKLSNPRGLAFRP